VAALPSIASSVLPAAIARVRAANPDVAVSVRDAVAGRISAMVATGEADVGLAGRPEAGEGLVFERLLADRLVAACPQDHPLAARRRIGWSDLARETFISMSRDSSVRRLVEQAFAQVGHRHEATYEVVYLSSAVSMAAAGLGIAVVPSSALSALNLQRIAVRPLVAPAVEREVGLLTSRARSLSPAARFFADALREMPRR
jgi:LysR family carnitine catabolism transcriptional activator